MKAEQSLFRAFFALFMAFTFALVVPVRAQTGDVNAGKLLYTTPLAPPNTFTCASGACHRTNPTGATNVQNIFRGANNPGAIANAIATKIQMAFLQGKLNSTQLNDLAAYIANSASAGGSPSALLSPVSLAFEPTLIGGTSASQTFIIDNTGTANLEVSSVTSGNSEFSVSSACASIAAGTGCNVSVSFAPSALGSHAGTITVSHNAGTGISTLNVSGTVAVPVAPGVQVTPTTLDFGAVTAGSFTGIQPTTVASVGTSPLVITSVSDAGPAFPFAGGTCAVGVAIAPGGSCTLFFRFVPSVAGTQSSVLAIRHNASAAATTVNLRGVGLSALPSTRTMVEYLYAPLNYYFITSRDEDKAVLDKAVGFQRTGLGFPVYAAEVAGSTAISRFFFDRIAVNESRGSHFYTLLDSDKAALIALNPGNTQAPRLPYNEGIDSWAFLPVISGSGGTCAVDQQPVFRLFRGSARFPDDPNHRYTTSLATYNEFVSLGWDGEGVSYCVPQQ